MAPAVIEQIQLGPMMNYSYLIADPDARVAAVVDPGWEPGELARTAKARGWAIAQILLTHGHFDHIGALETLVAQTGAPVHVHRADAAEVPASISPHLTGDGAVISVGAVQIRCLHTPGHTPGSQCFLVDNAVITGDTLFVDGCGRVDLPGSDPSEMLASLRELAALDPSTIVYPGHGYGPTPTATIGEQLKTNPYLSARSEGMLL